MTGQSAGGIAALWLLPSKLRIVKINERERFMGVWG
jgi:hypothetical protein